MFYIRAMEKIFLFVERWKVPFHSTYASWNGTFHLSTHENILTIALINIHCLYYNNNDNQFLYGAFPKSVTEIKVPTIYYYHCHQEIITIISLHLGVLHETIPCTAYRHLDCNIPPLQRTKYRYGQWSKEDEVIYAQVHNTMAVAELKLTTFGLWDLQVSTRPHVRRNMPIQTSAIGSV